MSEFCAGHVLPSDLAGFFARPIGGQRLDIFLGGPEAERACFIAFPWTAADVKAGRNVWK
jgi:hypothetical protein